MWCHYCHLLSLIQMRKIKICEMYTEVAYRQQSMQQWCIGRKAAILSCFAAVVQRRVLIGQCAFNSLHGRVANNVYCECLGHCCKHLFTMTTTELSWQLIKKTACNQSSWLSQNEEAAPGKAGRSAMISCNAQTNWQACRKKSAVRAVQMLLFWHRALC